MSKLDCTACYRSRCAGVIGLLVSLAALLPLEVVLSQTAQAPVSFNSGFASQGTAWIPTASWLQQRYQIETLTPNTSWDRPFAEQSTNFGAALTAWGRTGIVGISHSNGGVVARNYVHQNGASSRLSKLVTIGTPHQGAAIATNVLNGRVIDYFGSMAASIGGAVSFYANNDPDWNAGPVVDWITQDAFGALYYVGAFFANANALAGLGFAVGMPVTSDISPPSGWVTQFNSTAHLATESSRLQSRVGISTQVHPNGAFFRLISSSPGAWRTVQGIGAYGALALYFYYSGHPDWWLSANAYRWLQVYWYTVLLDVAWQDFIGALQYWNGVYAVVYRSDGFIPEWSSQYPGATLQFNMNLPVYNISHVEQKDHPDARRQVDAIFSQIFSIPIRPAAPPPPPAGTPCTPSGSDIVCPT